LVLLRQRVTAWCKGIEATEEELAEDMVVGEEEEEEREAVVVDI
jgi:hypothetical protein